MGTMLQAYNPTIEDFLGLENCSGILNLSHPPNLTELWSYSNPYMLYGRHLRFKGNFEKLLADQDPKALELFADVEKVKQEAAKLLKVRAVWRFFEAERDGNTIRLFEPGCPNPVHTFKFGRHPKSDGLCLSDYILTLWTGGAIILECSW